RHRLPPYGAGRLRSLVQSPWGSSTTRTDPDAALLLTRTLPSLPGRMIAMFDCVELASPSTVAAAGIDSSVDHTVTDPAAAEPLVCTFNATPEIDADQAGRPATPFTGTSTVPPAGMFTFGDTRESNTRPVTGVNPALDGCPSKYPSTSTRTLTGAAATSNLIDNWPCAFKSTVVPIAVTDAAS